MKNNDKIIDFFEGILTEQEKIQLLKEIELNSELKAKFEEFEKLYFVLNQAKNVKPNEDYLETIIPRFRNNSTKSILFIKPIYALSSFIILIAFSLLIYFNLINKNQTEFDIFSEVEQSNFLNNDFDFYAVYIEQEQLDDLMFNEILDKDNHNSLLNYLEIDNNYKNLTDGIVEEIYQELINKKIL